jgi:hypothetical protein
VNPAKIYIAWGTVFLASAAVAIFFHYFPAGIVGKAVGELAGVPAVLALFGALYQLGRDSIAHERTLILEETKNRFTVGATSHMAEVAFNKHVLFCEEYTEGVNRAFKTLFRRGPHEAVLEDADALADVRTRWSLWLTSQVEEQLVNFERALRAIGANAMLLADPGADGRTEAIKEAFSTLAAVLGLGNWRGEPVNEDVAARRIIEGLRNVLGVKELTDLRAKLVKRAFDNLE